MKKKKRLLAIVVSVLMVCAMMTVPTFAAGTVNMVVDGTEVDFPADLGSPYIDANSRTMVPLRATAQALGLDVEWDQASHTATFFVNYDPATDECFTGSEDDEYGKEFVSRVEANFTVGSSEYLTKNYFGYTNLNDEENASFEPVQAAVAMTTSTVNNNGRTFAPARYLAEAFGYMVDWNQDTHTVIVTTPDEVTASEISMDELSAMGVKLDFLGIWHDSSLGYEQLQLATTYAEDSNVSSLTLTAASLNGEMLVASAMDPGIIPQANYDFNLNARDGIAARFDESKLVKNCDASGNLVGEANTNVFSMMYTVVMDDGSINFVADSFVLLYDGIARGIQRV